MPRYSGQAQLKEPEDSYRHSAQDVKGEGLSQFLDDKKMGLPTTTCDRDGYLRRTGQKCAALLDTSANSNFMKRWEPYPHPGGQPFFPRRWRRPNPSVLPETNKSTRRGLFRGGGVDETCSRSFGSPACYRAGTRQLPALQHDQPVSAPRILRRQPYLHA